MEACEAENSVVKKGHICPVMYDFFVYCLFVYCSVLSYTK